MHREDIYETYSCNLKKKVSICSIHYATAILALQLKKSFVSTSRSLFVIIAPPIDRLLDPHPMKLTALFLPAASV